MPDAGRTREPCVQGKCTLAHASNDRAAGTTGIPRAMVLRLIRDLLGVPGCLAAVALRNVSKNLIPASGDRDRTISPYAFGASSLHQPRPSHPASHVRDDRDTPLQRRRDMVR